MRGISALAIMTLGLPGAALAQGTDTATAAASEAPAESAEAPQAGSEPSAALQDHHELLQSFQSRIRALSQRVEQAEARVDALKLTALSGSVMQTRATITHVNEVTGAFALESARYMLDGGVIFDREAGDGALDEERVQLFDGAIDDGPHELEVLLVFKGTSYGPFTYLEGYTFNVRSRYTFDVVQGRANHLEVVAFAREDMTVEPEKKLAIRYDVEVTDSQETAGP